MNEELEKVVSKATDFSGSKSRKTAKGILGIVIVVLLGALGLEATNNDFSIGSLLGGNSMSDSKIIRDAQGNAVQDSSGKYITQLLRNKAGDVVPAGTAGAKYTNEYNCDDFATQSEAQAFFVKSGGVSGDTNRLDGNKDGSACESLPKGK